MEFATPTRGSGPLGITLGPDGTDLWFAEIDSNSVGQIVFDGGGSPIRHGGDPRFGTDLAPTSIATPVTHSDLSDASLPIGRTLSDQSVNAQPEHSALPSPIPPAPAARHGVAALAASDAIVNAAGCDGDWLAPV